MIKTVGLNKTFEDNRKVLDDINVTFETGKVNLIIGQSGSGKTVLLKSLVGLHTIDSGKIYYDDKCYSDMDFKERRVIQQHTGMLFQGGALFDSMTVLNNVKFPLDVFTDKGEAEKIDIARKCLRRVEISDSADNLYPSEISGGMVKRVSIARGIVMNPKYLFCDEPNSGLDPKTAIVIDNLIMEITKEYNITTVINTHDMNSVMEIGENIVFINNGKIWWEGSNENILESENQELNDFVFASSMAKRAKGCM
ncbi:MAG: ATP-binding cassette domain-containing protein [Rikenellaceae bacterium]